MPEIIAQGAYRMNHVWTVTFKDADAVKKIVSLGDLKVKSARCLVIHHANGDVRIKFHWLLQSVPDDDVRLAFAAFGNVTDVSRERRRAQGMFDKGSTTKLVTLKLNAGVRLDDLLHQVSGSGELALVVVPGRAPLCLRCHGKGHNRREGRVPRCGTCQRFGHEVGQCPRTYANVTGPGNDDRSSELYMGEAQEGEAQEASQAGKPAAVLTKPPLDVQVAAEPCTSVSTTPSLQKDAGQEESAAFKGVSKELTTDGSNSVSTEADTIDISRGEVGVGACLVAGKHSREQKDVEEEQSNASASEEPPSKTAGMRRPTFKPPPNVPSEPRQTRKPLP
ncbi:hypothetical protein V5799_024441 [Amblyomma americanum]|uniref:Uncharacterized protein n=1 Tax=Amblyomma americanum TaxID=6943 RepID=A0AAQ4ECB6_AMBAM